MLFRIFALVILAAPAHADCAGDMGEFASCRIAGRDAQVSVCFDQETVTYSFGPDSGPPDLVLSEPVKTVAFEPWSGMTRQIGESVTFYNDGYSYEVVGGFDRMFGDETEEDVGGHFGWVEILRDGEKLAKLDCDPASVTYAFGGGLYDLKTRAGQVWDDSRREWVPKTD